ncbi:MAG: 23S rRNA (pseudouridine1915-N3)-methyltransferase [Gammaproteobacteria bacterium]|jgi:23S rRNA (pseudouridine1915-N3)-methyltransferase
MQVRILALGQKMPSWVDSACADYLKRFPREIDVNLTTLPIASRKSKDSVDRMKLVESKMIMEKLGSGGLNIALDEHGELWSSQDWAKQMESWMLSHPQVNLIIGGPDGLSESCRQACQKTVALGKITMPHSLARVVLVEQLYRALTILKGHPYHRE